MYKVLHFCKECNIIQNVNRIVYDFLVMITISEIPVPIPNTEVKRDSAEDTCGLPCWKNRLSLDFIYASLAQLVERSAVEQAKKAKELAAS